MSKSLYTGTVSESWMLNISETKLWAVAWLAGSSGFSDESALEVAPPDRRPDSRSTAFTTMRYINRRSLPFLPFKGGSGLFLIVTLYRSAQEYSNCHVTDDIIVVT